MATLSISALNGASPILQRELGAYFRSPVGTVFLVIFLLTALGCPFFLGNFYRSDGNPPVKPSQPEVEISRREFLHEEVQVFRQPDHAGAQARGSWLECS